MQEIIWEHLDLKRYNARIDCIMAFRGQWTEPEGEYWEGHHIIPECFGGLGGTKAKHPNIIRVSYEEHKDLHKVVYEDNKVAPLARAYACIHYTEAGRTTADENEFRKANSEAMSLWRTGQQPWNYGLPAEQQPRYGYITSEATKQLQRLHSPKNKCVQNLDTGNIYYSIHEAERQTGICNIWKVCSGERAKAGGYRWAYVNN